MTDIFLLGVGIRGTLQFTSETLQALQACDVAFVLHDDPDILRFVRAIGCEVVDAADYYPDAGRRKDVYRTMSDAIIERACAGERVGFLVHGHPLFLVSATEYTLETARDRGLSITVLPAVSSFDALLCELQLDFGYALQMFDATTLLQEKFALNPRIPLLLFQVATVLNAEVTRGDIPSVSLTPLVSALLKHYPPDHPCELIHIGTGLIERTLRDRLPLSALSTGNKVPLWQRPTLFVPPIAPGAGPGSHARAADHERIAK